MSSQQFLSLRGNNSQNTCTVRFERAVGHSRLLTALVNDATDIDGSQDIAVPLPDDCLQLAVKFMFTMVPGTVKEPPYCHGESFITDEEFRFFQDMKAPSLVKAIRAADALDMPFMFQKTSAYICFKIANLGGDFIETFLQCLIGAGLGHLYPLVLEHWCLTRFYNTEHLQIVVKQSERTQLYEFSPRTILDIVMNSDGPAFLLAFLISPHCSIWDTPTTSGLQRLWQLVSTALQYEKFRMTFYDNDYHLLDTYLALNNARMVPSCDEHRQARMLLLQHWPRRKTLSTGSMWTLVRRCISLAASQSDLDLLNEILGQEGARYDLWDEKPFWRNMSREGPLHLIEADKSLLCRIMDKVRMPPKILLFYTTVGPEVMQMYLDNVRSRDPVGLSGISNMQVQSLLQKYARPNEDAIREILRKEAAQVGESEKERSSRHFGCMFGHDGGYCESGDEDMESEASYEIADEEFI